MGREVAVVGVGLTPHGQMFPDKDWRQLLADAVYEALADAGMEAKEIKAATVAYQGEIAIETGGIGPLVSDYLGIAPAGVLPVSANCCGSTFALLSGYSMVASGLYDCVLVSGFEKELDPLNRFELINVSFDTDYDYTFGFSHKDVFGLMNNRYRIKYGYTLEPYAQWAVTCDWYAKRTPKARHYKTPPLKLEDAMQDSPLGDRLREMAMGEGSAAIILVSGDRARKYKKDPVYIKGISFKNAPHYVPNHWQYGGLKIEGAEQYDFAESPALMEAAREAYAMAKITAKDIDVVQVYDRQSAGIIALEALGCFPLGKGGKAVMDGETTLQGKYPTNTDGGAIRFGFASGAKGCVQVAEIVTQLRGEAGERQVPNARIGVCANSGGMFAQLGAVVLSNEL